jgi:hypothetical protein
LIEIGKAANFAVVSPKEAVGMPASSPGEGRASCALFLAVRALRGPALAKTKAIVKAFDSMQAFENTEVRVRAAAYEPMRVKASAVSNNR